MTLIKHREGSDLFPGILNRLFEDFDAEVFRTTAPAVNIRETNESYDIEVAAPGLKREDFQLSLDHNLLVISAEVKTENEENKQHYKRREFSYNGFKRSFSLPNSVKAEAIEATYKEGILHLHIPKKEEVKMRKIEIR